MTTTLIGIVGLAGSGKDTIAAELCASRGFVRISLADPIKVACQQWFGWDREVLWGPSPLRETPDPAWAGLTPRRALQQLGTEWGRAMHPDVWVRLAIRRAREYDRVVIPDVRFENEAAAIRAACGVVWRVVRPGLVAAEHESESGQSAIRADWTIDNAGPVAGLRTRALEALDELYLTPPTVRSGVDR